MRKERVEKPDTSATGTFTINQAAVVLSKECVDQVNAICEARGLVLSDEERNTIRGAIALVIARREETEPEFVAWLKQYSKSPLG